MVELSGISNCEMKNLKFNGNKKFVEQEKKPRENWKELEHEYNEKLRTRTTSVFFVTQKD